MNSTYAQKSSTVQKAADTKAASVLDSSAQSESLQRKADLANNAAQRAEAPRPNNTGMPDNLKAGIESLSGFSMDDVRVHYNSSKPATVQALAYTQGTDIHVAPGQEKCLPHEAWHVAQQMAGRVSPTTSINGMPVNDNAALEHEADVMGEKAVQCKNNSKELMNKLCVNQISVAQMIKCVCVSRPPNYKEYRIVDENYVLKGGECFVDKPWSSTDRNDVSADAYGYSNKQSDGVREMTLHRDHIIPHSKIMAFLDAAKPVSEKDATVSKPWIEDSLAVFYANARKSTPASGNDFQAPDDPELKAGKFLKDGITLANREMKKTLKLSKSDFDFIQKAT